jgi:DHA2 family multidrug resistance protein
VVAFDDANPASSLRPAFGDCHRSNQALGRAQWFTGNSPHPLPNMQPSRSAALELSQSPLVGILGVVLGAGIVTLTGRMLTLGTSDLKGSLGIGFDDGAWIGSAYNIALMFIGPFTVYLGGLLGPRRVLRIAAISFTLVCLLLPLIHNYSLLLTALVVAGLTSGTFYPLTLTFALKNIPPRFLPFTLALRHIR